jgi:hypothetical protein
LILIFLLITSCASNTNNKSQTNNYVRVNGVGETVEEAKNNAFKNAITLVVGKATLTQLEINNNQLIKDEKRARILKDDMHVKPEEEKDAVTIAIEKMTTTGIKNISANKTSHTIFSNPSSSNSSNHTVYM